MKIIRICALFLISILCFALISCQGEQGPKGEKGDKGENGTTPTITISDDGFWVINGEKTNVKAEGEKGDAGAQGPQGEKGDSATDENPQGLAFFPKDDGTYAVGLGNAVFLSEITIPATYKGKAVTEIGSFASNVYQGTIGDRLKKIIIPEGVTTIGRGAFAGCKTLDCVIIPESITTIEENAFDIHNPLVEIYYAGSRESFSKISVQESGNFLLSYASVYYDTVASLEFQTRVLAYDEMITVLEEAFSNSKAKKCCRVQTILNNQPLSELLYKHENIDSEIDHWFEIRNWEEILAQYTLVDFNIAVSDKTTIVTAAAEDIVFSFVVENDLVLKVMVVVGTMEQRHDEVMLFSYPECRKSIIEYDEAISMLEAACENSKKANDWDAQYIENGVVKEEFNKTEHSNLGDELFDIHSGSDFFDALAECEGSNVSLEEHGEITVLSIVDLPDGYNEISFIIKDNCMYRYCMDASEYMGRIEMVFFFWIFDT